MDKKTKFKEAVKLALAFAIVYGIALKVNWLSPSWAGWSVVAIAASSGAESLAKGLLRIWGTILACIIGITIISLGAQNRWLFMLLTATWVAFCTYKMLANKEKSYFWFVTGYVTLVITAAGPSSLGGFYIAVFRTLETIMGIVVFTLISVFLWPRSNIGAIKIAVGNLLETQTKLFQGLHDIFNGTYQLDALKQIAQLQVKQFGEFSRSLTAEGSENYQVKELKPLWIHFQNLNENLLKSLDKMFGGIEDLSRLDNKNIRPDLEAFFKEINHRFTEMASLFSSHSTHIEVKAVKLKINSISIQGMSHFDKAAIAIILAELNHMDAISRNMVEVAMSLKNDQIIGERNKKKQFPVQKESGFIFPILDIEYLKGSLYVFLIITFGFVIWFYLNPPGHSTWYIMGGVFGLIFAGAQQVKTLKLILPFLIAMVMASLIYVFILPQLTMFYQLGLLLFVCMFIIQYFLPGPAAAVFTIATLQLIAVNNPQTYDASALLNSFVFVTMLMIYLYGMSYIIQSPRPEKAFLRMVSRFFESAKYLVSHQLNGKQVSTNSLFQNYKTNFHLHELNTLPLKIKAWGKAIDKNLFPNTDYQKINEMVNSLDVLVIRMETLMEVNNESQGNEIVELSKTISDWRKRLINAFDGWDDLIEEEIASNSSEKVQHWMNDLEEKLEVIEQKNREKINEAEGIQFYHILGGYRGVTEATLSFVNIADQLDWKHWKEERFQ